MQRFKRTWLPLAVLAGLFVTARVTQTRIIDAPAVLAHAASSFDLEPADLQLVGSTFKQGLFALDLEGQFQLAQGGQAFVEVHRGFPFAPWMLTHYRREP